MRKSKYSPQKVAKILKEFEKSENVSCYAKLPSWFKIETPLGSYNPDWAVVWKNSEENKVFFVCESKGSMQVDLDLKGFERAKIQCGKQHFEQTSDIDYEVITSIEDLSGLAFSK